MIAPKTILVSCALVSLLSACAHDTVGSFPRFSESQSEWIQSRCRITYAGEMETGVKLVDAKAKLDADVVERFASSSDVVQIVAYKCREPVPVAIARGEL